jgi:hypothetical protein
MDQENSQSWSVGCSDGRQKLECRGGRATTECGCQKWFGGSARYMKSECAFNFSPCLVRVRYRVPSSGTARSDLLPVIVDNYGSTGRRERGLFSSGSDGGDVDTGRRAPRRSSIQHSLSLSRSARIHILGRIIRLSPVAPISVCNTCFLYCRLLQTLY